MISGRGEIPGCFIEEEIIMLGLFLFGIALVLILLYSAIIIEEDEEDDDD